MLGHNPGISRSDLSDYRSNVKIVSFFANNSVVPNCRRQSSKIKNL